QVVYQDRFSRSIGWAAKMGYAEGITEDRDRGRADAVVIVNNRAAGGWNHLEAIEVVSRNEFAARAFGMSFDGESEGADFARMSVSENVGEGRIVVHQREGAVGKNSADFSQFGVRLDVAAHALDDEVPVVAAEPWLSM